MLPWDNFPGHITEDAQAYGATTRDDIISTGAEVNVYVDTIFDRKTSSFVPPTAQSSQHLEDTIADGKTTSRATTTPPTEDVNATSKRSASAQLTDQPDLKSVIMSTPLDGNDNGGGSGVDETDVPSSQHPQQLEHTTTDDNTTLREKSNPSTEDVDATPKRSASAQPAGQPDLKSVRMSTSLDDSGNGGGDGDDDTDPPSIQLPQQLKSTLVDDNTASKAKNPPPTKNFDITQKRSASQPPVGQPDAKKVQQTHPPTANVDITPNCPASGPPADQLHPKKVQLAVLSDVTDVYGGFLSIPQLNVLAKRRALAQQADQLDTQKARVFFPLDASGGGGGFGDVLSPFFREVTPTLRASTEVPGETSSGPELVAKDGAGDKEKGKVDEDNNGKDNVDKNKNDKNEVDKAKVDDDDDDDEVELVSATTVTPVPVWTEESAASRSAKQNKGKQSQQLETPGTEASPSAKKPAAKASSVRGKNISRALNLEESEAADDEEEEEDEDPQVAKKKIAQAEKAISKLCRSCKINANKEWKTKHDTTVSKLNHDHKAAVRILKEDNIAAVKKVKATADKEKKAAKIKAEDEADDAKDASDEKFNTMKAKLEGEVKTLKKNFAAEKVKVAGLKVELEHAEEKRKKIEKDTADKVKSAEADLKAGELRLKEKWKQLKREVQAEIDQWKPVHSKALKDNQRVVKELTQKVVDSEKLFEHSEADLRRARKQYGAEKNNHEDTLKKLGVADARVSKLEDTVLKSNDYCRAVEVRALAQVVRVEEDLVTVRANLQQQSNRIVNKQRENYQLGDAMRTHAKLAEARKAEIEALKKQLQAAQAELGVAKALEEADGMMGEAVDGHGITCRGEGVKGETAETK
jgi:hypothetical protein